MTAAAAEAISGSTGPKVVPGGGSDGAAAGFPASAAGFPASAAPSHRLDALKHERHELRRRLSRLLEARSELEQPSLRLAEIEAGRRLLDDDHGSRLNAWVSSGCTGPQPEQDQARLADLTTRLGAAQEAARAAAQPLAVIEARLGPLRAQLSALNGQITVEAASVLAASIDLAALQEVVDQVNSAMAVIFGLRAFLSRDPGNLDFLRRAERLSSIASPAVGATRAEIEREADRWSHRYEELVK